MLEGGLGNDRYFVDQAGDQVVEAAGGGFDTVFARANYTLGAGQQVEVLRSGNDAAGLLLVGNELDNTLVSGGGSDALRGMGGNDTYVVNGSGDRVVEAVGGGSDTVRTSVDYMLSAGQEIESLRAEMGTTNGLALTGNAFANSVFGGAGDDRLAGGGGTDSLLGGSGSDTFVFRTLSDSSVGAERDTILDFTPGEDRIDLSGIQAVSGASSDQAFTFIGTGAFTKQAGQLHQTTSGGSKIVEGDTNGDGAADFQVALSNLVSLREADFIL